MNIVDSSGWLEYFAGGQNADFFATAIEDTPNLLVPTICIYEVFKSLMTQMGENTALVFIGDMLQGQNCDVTSSIALQAAKISIDFKLAMADSLILATARDNNAILWTQDANYQGLEGVQYIPKNPS